MGISHGTEMLVYHGELPLTEKADETLSALSCPMSYPIKYGYINVGLTREDRRIFAFFPHQSRFYLPANETVPIPDDIPTDDAVFLASTETALTIAQDCAIVPGDAVLLIGQGVIGLLVAAILIRSHLGPIVSVERHELRRLASADLGCLALASVKELRVRTDELTGGRGFDLAVDVSASTEGLQAAIDALAFNGNLVEGSCFGGREVKLRLGDAFHRKRLVINSSQVSTVNPRLQPRWDKNRRMEYCLQLLREIRPSRFISHRFPLARAADAYRLIDQDPGQTLQIVLEP
jgi:alcohol dehydrogenase